MRWQRSRTLMSARRKVGGIWSSLNSRSTGSLGLVLCRKRFAARTRNSGFGRVGHGPLPICSSRTYIKFEGVKKIFLKISIYECIIILYYRSYYQGLTSSTIADAGLNMFSVAFFITATFIFAVLAASIAG